jgi:hypothetical protein
MQTDSDVETSTGLASGAAAGSANPVAGTAQARIAIAIVEAEQKRKEI